MHYLEVFETLSRLKIRYLLVGGVAVVFHGIMRLTADLDLFIDLSKENVLTFIQAMNELGYQPKVPVKAEELADPPKRKEWQETKNMKVFSFVQTNTPYNIIDVFIDEPMAFNDCFSRRQIIKAGGADVSVISRQDLIALKKISAREQDMLDIKMLETLMKNEKN